MKTTSQKIKTLKNKLDKLWVIAVNLQGKGECEYCGRTKETNVLACHHVFGRVNKATRWNVNNGILLDWSHHTGSSGFSAHKTVAEFMEWIRNKRGEEWYEELRKQSQEVFKLNLGNLTAKKEELENIIKEFQ